MKNPIRLSSFSNTSPFKANCSRGKSDDEQMSTSSAYNVLDILPDCSLLELKSAFRAKVKEFLPDVWKGEGNSDTMIRRVIQAYEILSNFSRSEIIESEYLDPFDNPESEALDIFVNESICVGRTAKAINSDYIVESAMQVCFLDAQEIGPPPRRNIRPLVEALSSHILLQQELLRQLFKSDYTGYTDSLKDASTDLFIGHGEDYKMQLAVGQCPQSCIHYVTPSQRVILEELLESIMNVPFDTSAEADLLYSLIVKAKYENDRYQTPKKQPKVSTNQVDWF